MENFFFQFLLSVIKTRLDVFELRFDKPFVYKNKKPSIVLILLHFKNIYERECFIAGLDCDAFRANRSFIQSPFTVAVHLDFANKR